MEQASLIRQIRMDSSDSSCSNRTRSIASLGGSEDSILEERTTFPSGRPGNIRQLSDSLISPEEQDSGFSNSNLGLEPSSPTNGSLRCRTPEIKSQPRAGAPEDLDDVWLPRFPRARKLGLDRTLGTSGSLGSTDSWIENSVSEEDEDMDDGDIARCLTSMSMGSGVIKVKGSGRCTVKTLYLDGNKSCLRWRPSKKGNKAKISIESIKEVREGPNTDSFKKFLAAGNKCHTKTCFSIIHGSSWDTFDLIVETEEETAIWIRGLKHLLKGVKPEVRRLNNNKLRDCWLKATFEAADKSGDGLLSMDEVLKLLHKLNVNLSKRKVKQLFKEADSQDENIGKLDFDEFIQFYRTISTRQEVDVLLRDYGHGKGYMTLEEFARYLRDEQGMGNVEPELCQEFVQTYEPIPENSKNGWMGIDGFTRFLLSHEGDIFNPAHREVNQDMTQPMSHYYIASSHNTYLVGDQLMSQSSVDIYALVLQAGCRCVEMDCWDGKEGEPIIYHGYTLTSKIKFRDVISIISKYAFITSPYPVILSIENHCSLEQQKKMAQYLVEILGEMLHVPAVDPSTTTLPSPEELKGKILIKAKKLPEDHNENLEAGEVSEEDSADELDDELKLERSSISKKFESVAMAQLMLMRKKPITPTRSAWQRIISKVREDSKKKDANSKNHARSSSLTGTLRRLKLSKKKPKSQSSSESSEGGSLDLLEKSATDDEMAGDTSNTSNPKSPSPQPMGRSQKGKSMVLCRQLSQLVQLTQSVGFRGFKSGMASWELPSLGEIRASNFVATKAPEFTQFTANHLCRVYPSAYRIDSSNYNPQPMWNCGCQLVALNYQTEGRPIQLSRAKFSVNGNCGYVLKHPLLCDENKPFDPNSGDPVPHLPRKQLTLHIISGQQLPKPPQSLLGERGEIIDPYVEVEVVGLAVDCAKSQTKTIQDNGFNPFWDCTMTFTIHLPEMALIRFAVWDEDPIGRDFIGQTTLPIVSLMPGYRHIHLEGLDQATIFVHVTMEDYDSWVNNTARYRPRGSQCRTKSVELEYSPLSSSPTHHRLASPRRKSSLGLVQKLNMRRRHSMAALPPRELSPLPAPGMRMKRRSYEEGHMTGSAGELSPGGEEVSQLYFELALPCTDTAVNKILDSPVKTRLEADGTFSISVDDLPTVMALDIPPSTLFEAVREQKVSLWSEGSYTAVERTFTVNLLTEEELPRDVESGETESLVSSLSYEQFVQDVFEDCFSPDLSYDPCPDLLKEASPSHGPDKQETPNAVPPNQTTQQSGHTACPGDCSREVETTSDGTDSSDDDSDDVFLSDASEHDDTPSQQVVKEHNSHNWGLPRQGRPPPFSIPNQTLGLSPSRSPSSSCSSPLLTPNSPNLGTFSRGTVERRSRIIYDDTAEFLQPSAESADESYVTFDQRAASSVSVTMSLVSESDTVFNKHKKETQGFTDITNDCESRLMNDKYANSTSSACSQDLVSITQSDVSLSDDTDEKGSICNNKDCCANCGGNDMLLVSGNDVISNVSNADSESSTSSNLLRNSSQDKKASDLFSPEQKDPEMASTEEQNRDSEGPTKDNPHILFNRLQNDYDQSDTEQNQTSSGSQISQSDSTAYGKVQGSPSPAPTNAKSATGNNDMNNNGRFSLQLLVVDKVQQTQEVEASHNQGKEKSGNAIQIDAVQYPKWMVDNDGNESDNSSDDDSDADDSSSSTSSSSNASSTSSSDTVVEVPPFASVPKDILSKTSPSKNSISLSPLKLEDIFDPSECQQFRSELVQHWQRSSFEDQSVCHSTGPTYRDTKRPSASVARETQRSPVSFSGRVDGPKPYSPLVSGIKCRSKVMSCLADDRYKKRLSWPPSSSGKKAFMEKRSNWESEVTASLRKGSIGNGLGFRGDNPNLGAITDQRFMPKPAARCTVMSEQEEFVRNSNQLSSQSFSDGLHPPDPPQMVYRSHLSQLRLSSQMDRHFCSSFNTSDHPAKHREAQRLPSYFDDCKKSNSLPPRLTGTKSPPSYEDHISRYGLPTNFKPPQAKDSHKHSPQLKLWRAEPVMISQVRTIHLRSAADIFKMKQDQTLANGSKPTVEAESYSESQPDILLRTAEAESDGADTHVSQKQCSTMQSCSSLPSTRKVQCHPTPPRRRKQLQRSSSDESMALLNNKLLKGGKKLALNSGKNHSVYLMLTL
ncbi:uncharacterized protein LOC110989296 isoform X2 [Acanthaster planci]|uniref:Phosphoinositide phospholipase C n=1 Tax=Acanthaster planci TaxID=133434 RepID=A0A8B7ZV29_ACAPL|nr:uncharacterized protein LOC110989296 isoform X2 [Acanthaster planci]